MKKYNFYLAFFVLFIAKANSNDQTIEHLNKIVNGQSSTLDDHKRAIEAIIVKSNNMGNELKANIADNKKALEILNQK